MLFEYIASKFDAINYNGANSALDYHLIMRSKSIGEAEIDEIRETVPYMNGDYDFTGKFAPVSYRNRKITVSFKLFMESENDLWQRKSEIINWLTSERGGNLTFDSIKDYIFKKCSCKIKSFKQDKKDTRYAILDIEITCSPYVEKPGKELVPILSYDSAVSLYMRYGTGDEAYFMTDVSPEQIQLSRAASTQSYTTTQELYKKPCLLVAYDTDPRGTAFCILSTSNVLPLLDTVETDDGYLRIFRYDPELDGFSGSSAYIRYDPYETTETVSKVVLIQGDNIRYDANKSIILTDHGRIVGNLSMDGGYVLETSLDYSSLTLSQNKPREVLL